MKTCHLPVCPLCVVAHKASMKTSSVILTFESIDEIPFLRQYFCMVPFVFQYNMYLTKRNFGFFLIFDIWHPWECQKMPERVNNKPQTGHSRKVVIDNGWNAKKWDQTGSHVGADHWSSELVQLISFLLNGQTWEFHPQIQELLEKCTAL